MGRLLNNKATGGIALELPAEPQTSGGVGRLLNNQADGPGFSLL